MYVSYRDNNAPCTVFRQRLTNDAMLLCVLFIRKLDLGKECDCIIDCSILISIK